METFKDAVAPEKTYHVVSVVKTEPPAGIEGGTWYRYEIALESNSIVGNRRGTLQQVTEYARDCAENMSARVARGNRKQTSKK